MNWIFIWSPPLHFKLALTYWFYGNIYIFLHILFSYFYNNKYVKGLNLVYFM